jgi:hypothetical protein
MRQTTLSVPLEVKPESCARITALIDAVKRREDKSANPAVENFARLVNQVPVLHFMSMSVFPATEYDPLFILEANFDGTPGPFWAQLEAILGPDLRAMLRCCKRPLDGTGALYDAVTLPDSHAPIAPYMEARTQFPSVYHHGNRGLTRDRILDEYSLFLAVRDQLDKPASGNQDLSPTALQAQIRSAVLPGHGWLDQPAPERITTAENLADWCRMFLFVLITLLALSAPGLLLATLLPWTGDLKLLLLMTVFLWAAIYWVNRRRRGTEITTTFKLSSFLSGQPVAFLIVALVYVIGASLVLTPLASAVSLALHFLGIGPALGIGTLFWPTTRTVLMGLVSLALLTLPVLVLLLRWNELRDSSQDAPQPKEQMLEDMLRREDWVTQNHMGSIVLIKPGILRSIIIRAGHLGLFLVLRLVARDGYLGSMRTVHFAHWAFLNNGSRLLFFSNFDHSWGSYLDDFIEKAHAGLTLAWGCGVGFPPTRFLVYDGASHGRQFKAWALASRAVSRFWYSAYPDLTVDQVERNHRVANGLRKTNLESKEAEAWMLDL